MLSKTKTRRVNEGGSPVFSHFTLVIFSLSLFLSASLMFAVQPMIGKMLLPLAGGTPASWVVAMAFFQIALLAGYMLAWIMSRFDVRVHTLMLVGCLCAGFLFLPIAAVDYSDIITTHGMTAFGVLLLLICAVGLPFTALSTVSSTLQRLFTATNHKDANDPYFLYAASNIGSLIGLMSYPFFVEPVFDLSAQSIYWRFLYGGLIVLCLFCLGLTYRTIRHGASEDTNRTEKIAPVTWTHRGLWFALAFVPASLLMGTTSHITTNILSMPLLWVLPLGLYLLTHILAFARRTFFKRESLYMIHPIAVGVLFFFSVPFAMSQSSWFSVIVLLISFFFIAMTMHARLADARPNAKFLTQFYFFLALGGAVGGSFNAFFAPLVFDSIAEFQLVAILSCFLNPVFYKKDKNLLFLQAGFSCLLLFLVFRFIDVSIPGVQFESFKRLCLMLFLILVVSYHPKITALCTAVAFLTLQFLPIDDLVLKRTTLETDRNFFGVIRVSEKVITDQDNPEDSKTWRIFTHGTTIHGFQILGRDLQADYIPSYYGPLKMIMDIDQPQHIGLIGLGAGTVRCYLPQEHRYTMYEIDPVVVDIAEKYFDFLSACGDENDAIVIGDGRLEMEKRTDDKYDLIILDAFTSDSIPMHLITSEAMQMYQKRLTEKGRIAVHISNRYLNLLPIVSTTAEKNGLQAHFLMQLENLDKLQVANQWVVLSAQGADTHDLTKTGWLKINMQDDPIRHWTDQYSNILSILRKQLF